MDAEGVCRFCGALGFGESFDSWVPDTFMNYDLLVPGSVICHKCAFWFEQKSVPLQQKMNKDKPQKMQNYSHFLLGEELEWVPVSKGNKREMARLLLTSPFPRMAAIAVSGQKHLAFRARRNPPGESKGWIQFEEQAIWIYPGVLLDHIETIKKLINDFSKSEIGSGIYSSNRIMKFGLDRWDEAESKLRKVRGSPVFPVALFLSQKDEDNGDI